MEGNDTWRTADRLDELAGSWSGPGAAQTEVDEAHTKLENPLTGKEIAVPTRFELAFPA